MALTDRIQELLGTNTGAEAQAIQSGLSRNESITSNIPNVYKGNIPAPVQPNLSPLQLALLNYLTTGNPPPLMPNEEFLTEMKTACDSDCLEASTTNAQTGLPQTPSITPGYTGVGYVSLGDQVYLVKRAENCGPNEQERYDYVSMGDRTKVANGTFAYYGGPIENGTVARGSGTWVYLFYNEELTLSYVDWESYRTGDD